MRSKPLLQVAFDCQDLDEALELADAVLDYADILEIGTALLKKEGVRSLAMFKERFSEKLLFADTKTIDIGKMEARMVFEAGADMMSVCGVASDQTIEAAIHEARNSHKQVMIDMINLSDAYRQVKRLAAFQPDYLAVHTGVDERIKKDDLFEQVEMISRISPVPFAISGGVQLDDVSYLMLFHPSILVVGAAITAAPLPEEAARRFWNRIHTLSFLSSHDDEDDDDDFFAT